jgi:uncharacterized membrane protein
MTNFRKFALTGALALALGSAFTGLANAQAAGGNGGGGGGGASDIASAIDTPVTHATVPGGQTRGGNAPQARESRCGFELLRGRYCEPARR